TIKKENKKVQEIVSEKKIDGVISDNRFGFFSKKVPSVFITHQLDIRTPVFKNIINKMNENYMEKFTECWIPDDEGENNLSGSLSYIKEKSENYKFIGPLTRFERVSPTNFSKNEDFILVLISGPENQRTIFEEKILKLAPFLQHKVIISGGKPCMNNNDIRERQNVEYYAHLEPNEMGKLISNAKMIVARSGYSTIMDLAWFGKSAILVPTPGQSEQEYLAQYHHKKKNHVYCVQDELNSEILNEKLENKGILKQRKFEQRNRILEKFLNKC
ncbi:MAG: glycosyltransferase, partial [Flavobacteriales bacterium]